MHESEADPNPLIPPSTMRRGRWLPSGFHLHLFQTILWPVWHEDRPDDATWPVWNFVVRSLKQKGFSAEELFVGLPAPIDNGTREGYGFIWRSNSGASALPQPGEKVGLTLAGLRLAGPMSPADNLAQLAASFAVDEDALPNDPNEFTQKRVPFNDRAARELARGYQRAGVTSMTVQAAAELLMHEHPSLVSQSSDPGLYEVHIGPDNFGWLAGVADARSYLNAVWARYRSMNANRQDLGIVAAGRVAETHATGDTEEMVDVSKTASSPDPRKVFVIHGRNDAARRGLFEFLRSVGLSPIEWSEALGMAGEASPYIGDVLDAAFGAAQAVVVLETPDDIAYLHPSLTDPDDPECQPQPQPRPNVLFEAGMAMGRDPKRTVIVELGQIRVFSDIHGRHVVRLDNSVAKRQDLAQRLQKAGCSVNLSGTDWHGSGDLTPPAPPGGGMPLGRKLPTSAATGMPRLDAKYIDHGDRAIGEVEVTNHGPGDVYDLDVTTDDQLEDMITRSESDLPVPQLPAGKSVRVMRIARTLGSPANSYFYLTVTGKTLDGAPIESRLFVSGV